MRINNSQIMDSLNQLQTLIENQGKVLASLDARVSALETQPKAETKKSSKKTSATRSKKTSTKSSGDFDRALYESTAKKLGVYNTEYGKVTATVKDGKVISTAKQNREKVYKAMGITK